MTDGTREYQQMAVAILAIATAALGFGLWSQNLAPPEIGGTPLRYAQRALGLIATIFYFGTFVSVGRLLAQKGRITGQDLVTRPMVWLYLQMLALALLFFAGHYAEYLAEFTAAGQGGPAGEAPAMPNDPLPIKTD